MRRRAIEACTGDYRVTLEDRADPGRGDIRGAIGPANCHPLRARRAHAFEVTDDAVRHALAGRDELALAAGACREFANESLRDCTADAHREDPVARLLRLVDNGLPIGDLSVRHQKDVGRFRAAGHQIGLAQSVADLGAAHVRVERLGKTLGLGEVGLVARKRPIGHHVGRVTEGDQRNSIVRLQPFENAFERLLRLLHRVSLHGAGAIDDDGEVQRSRLLQSWEERLEARHGSQPVAVLAAEDEAARRLRGLHVQDEVAVHDRLGLAQREHDALRRLHELDGVRWADELGVAQRTAHLDAQRELVLDRE